MSKTAILKTCFEVMHYSGAAHVLRPYFAGKGVIFCLHHVRPAHGLKNSFAPNSNLEVTPEFLSEIITLVKGLGYDLVSLAQAVERLRSGGVKALPFAAFTLDDGYRDNLVHALPVFRRFKCPFTVFVAPGIADGTTELWWRAVEALIAERQSLDVTLNGEQLRFETHDDSQKLIAWNRLAPLVQALPEYEQRQWIRRVCDAHGIDLEAMCRATAMTWNEIRQMNADPLATIGAHTLNHYNLMRLPEDDARREIAESGRRVADELGEPTLHFAYPYGNTDAAGPREFALAAQAGYQSAVTTRLGVIFPAHAEHLQALPRVMVSGRFQKIRYIDALISGMPSAMKNRFRALNVG